MPNEYQLGGSVTSNSDLYIERHADKALTKALEQNELCYIFNTRQIGKSSLLLKTKNNMQAKGYLCSYIDISRIGSVSISAEQWYAGLAFELWRNLTLPSGAAFFTWWQSLADIPPPQKLAIFWQEYLPIQFPEQKIILSFDEVDSVISLPFAADDFFAVMRSCYNAEQTIDNSNRVNFALFGVALPTDLIKDPTKAPFNIGKAIALDCFTHSEALSLLTPFVISDSLKTTLLTRVLYWTGGQPFLTQKLLAAILVQFKSAESFDINEDNIDQLVQEQFIENWRNNDSPEHLKTIYDRITLDSTHNVQLLSDYLKVCHQETKPENLNNYQRLYLTGLIHIKNKHVVIKSHLYRTIFSTQWAEAEIAKLRPYHLKMQRWISENLEQYLLTEDELLNAKSWASTRSISELDHLYLSKSQDKLSQEVKQKNIQLNNEIKQRRLTEDKLQKTLVELDIAKSQAEKANNAKSHFLAKVSHEIRTHVNSIIGINYLARKQPDHTEHLISIDRAAQYMQTVINDLVDINQIERGELSFVQETFFIDSIIDNLININGPMIFSKDIDLLINVPKTLTPAFVGDPHRIEQILSNLVSNAIKYCSIGTISIDIKQVSCLNSTNVCYQFVVSDTGVGLNKQTVKGTVSNEKTSPVSMGIGLSICHELLSIMNSQLHVESVAGQGTQFSFNLDLNVSQQAQLDKTALPKVGYPATLRPEVVNALLAIECQIERIDFNNNFQPKQLHDKKIDIFLVDENYQQYQSDLLALADTNNMTLIPLIRIGDSFPHWLTTLGHSKRIDLPTTPRKLYQDLMTACKPAVIQNQELTKISQHYNYNVLVAEDDEINQEVIRSLLGMIGVNATIVNNGEEAVSAALLSTFDLILMDIEMPLMNGLEAIDKLKNKQALIKQPYLNKVPIIAMTAHALLGDKEKFIREGMNDHISKPIEPDQLHTVLSQWLPQVQDIEHSHSEIGFPHIKDISIEEALARCNNNVLLYQKLLMQFANKYHLISPLDNSRNDQLRLYFHAIKGTAGNLGANKMSNLAAQFEQRAINDEIISPDDLADFSQQQAQLCHQIKQTLEESLEHQTEQNAQLPRTEQEEQFDIAIALKLQKALSEDHSKAIDICTKLESNNTAEVMAICQAINVFDIDQAHLLLSNWMKEQS